MTSMNKYQIPTWVLVTIDGTSIALVAIFIFIADPWLVLSYGLIVAMFLSHFFMHARQGDHHSHHEKGYQVNSADKLNTVPVEIDDPQNPRRRFHG